MRTVVPPTFLLGEREDFIAFLDGPPAVPPLPGYEL
jgi:hypothetical protein